MTPTKIVIAITILSGLPASMFAGDVTPIGVFAGGISEDWETFPLYSVQPGTYLPTGTTIFGGKAAISGNRFAVYRPGGGNGGWGLNTSGQANVANGGQGAAIEGFYLQQSIVFTSPVSDFGGYWAAATGNPPFSNPTTITVSFFDAASVLIDTQQFQYSRSGIGDGMLIWQGWHSTTPIKTITMSGHGMVMDFLQANLAPLPPTCYPNCDGSTSTPSLTPNDFQCFLNAYANQLASANCDGSTGTPSLTPNDFQCFLNAYAAGCS